MTTTHDMLSDDKHPKQPKTREMYQRLITVAELLKKSAHQQNDTVQDQQRDGEKTQDSKAVVS